MSFDIAAKLAELDASFTASLDPMAALATVALAAKARAAIPPSIAEWLRNGINTYRKGESNSLDEALGLNAVGFANPRARAKQQGALEMDLAHMLVLYTIGATVAQAAILVERLGRHKAATLTRKFNASGQGAKARLDRAAALQHYHRSEVKKILEQFPDDVEREVATTKAAILSRYNQ